MAYRVALYCRVSTSDQHCETQLHELREYVSNQSGWEIYNEYLDSGFSGTKASRPALDSLMKDASKKKFNAVVVYKLDRFGRSVLNLSQSLAALDSYGVRFISTSQNLDTNACDPASRFLLNILSSVAAFEVEMIRERTLSGIRAARSKGKTLGRPKKVFRRDEVVRLRDAEGLSWRLIGEKLNVPAMTAYNAYQSQRTKNVPESGPGTDGKGSKSRVAV
ncbi:MAG: recombinase family protein [Acidobacteriia bacterium]|nr:recombinase family protein [Terriglobia bacterium]